MEIALLEKDGDSIYEEYQELQIEYDEDEYREDRMDQLISKYG